MSAISDFCHVVMLLSPWEDPITLQRAWCLFEAYCSAKTKCRFEVALTGEQKRLFFEAIMEDTDKHINNMLSKIDCERSECYKPEDRDKIFDVVRREVGFGTINSMVFEQLRNWVVAVTKEELESCNFSNTNRSSNNSNNSICNSNIDVDERIRYLKLETALGGLYQGQGKYDEAEVCFKHCFDTRKADLGLVDEATLKSEHNLAILYLSQRQIF